MVNVQKASILRMSAKAYLVEADVAVKTDKGESVRPFEFWVPKSMCVAKAGFVTKIARTIMISRQEEISTKLKAKGETVITVGIVSDGGGDGPENSEHE